MSTSEFDPTNNTQHGIRPEDMPPLGPTAEVPMQHSEKVNSDEYWNKKLKEPAHNEKKGFGKKIAAGVAGAALLGGLFAGTKLASGEDSPEGPSNTEPVATATETPGNTTSEPTSEPTTPDVSPTLERPSSSDWNPSPIVNILDQANATEFEQYPTKDRVQFIVEVEDWFARANIGFEYTDQRLPGINKYGEDKTVEDLNYMFNPQTKTSSAQTIVEHQLYVDALNGLVDENHLAEEGYATDTTELDVDTSRKLTSGLYADPNSNSYRLISDSRADDPEKGRIKDELVTSIKINSSTPNYDKKDFENNVRPHKDINYSDANGTYNITVAYYELENPIKSEVGDLTPDNGLWLTTYHEMWDKKVK